MIHVISLPHTDVSPDWSQCAYTQKVRRFGSMLPDMTLYASDRTEGVDYGEVVSIVTQQDRARWFGDETWRSRVFDAWDPDHPAWREMGQRAIEAIRPRFTDGDTIGIIAGRCQAMIADAFPSGVPVEWGCGYIGVLDHSYRVWESNAWRAHVAGLRNDDTFRAFDETIPNFYDIADFPEGTGQGGYYLYMGRLMSRKGPQIAADACRRLGAKLLVAGQGVASTEPGKITCTDGTTLTGDVEYVGVVGPEERAKLMGDAIALFCPTLYLEPFGGVSVEAQLTGTPAIVSDWGGLPENIIEGVTGFACNILASFAGAAQAASQLDRTYIRQHAQATWGMDAIRPRFEAYFERLETLKGAGFYA